MRKTVSTYKGIKYSLQPHGLRSKLLVAFAFFVGSFAVFVLGSPADAANPSVYVTLCGNSTTWYVNPDEWTADTKDDGQGDRRPLATSDGLVFSPTDLIHHQLDFIVTPALVAGTFVASPTPDIPDFFSIEVVNDDGTGYATLRWNSTSSLWEVTTGGATHTDTDPAALLTGLGKSTHARTFGVGYTNAPPGTVTSLVSKISFQGVDYVFACAVPTVTVNVPGPTVTITKNQTVTVTAPAPTQSATATPSPSPTPTPTLSPSTSTPGVIPTFSPASSSGSDGGNGLLPWGIGVAALAGAGLAAAALAKRRRANSYQAAHSVDNAETQLIPAYPGDDDYGVSDYDPSLGGHPGESWFTRDPGAMVGTPPASEEPTPSGNSDTEQIPPVAPPAASE